MAIADCGFSNRVVIGTGTNKPKVISGRDALIMKGPTISVEIGFNQDLFDTDPAKVQQAVAAAHAQPPAQLVDALVDTGAYDSCIDEELAKTLQLPLIDQQEGSGIGGAEKFNVYLGHIRIATLGFLQYGRFMGVHLKAGKQPHQALLGRTVLRGMIMVYDGRTGSVRLAI